MTASDLGGRESGSGSGYELGCLSTHRLAQEAWRTSREVLVPSLP